MAFSFCGCGTLTPIPHLLIITSWKFYNHGILSPVLCRLMCELYKKLIRTARNERGGLELGHEKLEGKLVECLHILKTHTGDREM